jgi:hypothetical protein
MENERLEIGDRVITLQMPGIFRVVARDGEILTILAEKGGVRLRLHEAALRRPLEEIGPLEDA